MRDLIMFAMGAMAGAGAALILAFLLGRIDRRSWLCPRCAHRDRFPQGDADATA